MRNTNKKGFTIVELVIVVAVIAILAAVLIPTFSGIIAKAQLSADQRAVRDMNNAIAMESATTLDAAMAALEKHGINAKNLIPVSAGWSLVWNETEKKIELVEGKVDESIDEAKKNIAVTVNSAEAFLNAIDEDMKYIKLEADVTLPDEVLTLSGNVTIDLNGNNLNASASTSRPFNMSGDSTLTINATNSVVDSGIFGIVNIVDNSNATLVINGGTFKGDLKNGAFLRIRNNVTANITLNDVTFIDAHKTYASAGDSFFIDKNVGSIVNITVNGGSFTGYMGFINANNAVIKNATINTTGVAVVTINGEVSGCDITVGNLLNNGAPTAAVSTYGNGNVSVSGCTITTGGDNAHAFAVYSSGGTIVASGNNLSTYGIYVDNSSYPDAEYLVKIDGVSYTE